MVKLGKYYPYSYSISYIVLLFLDLKYLRIILVTIKLLLNKIY
jgi:hypothetical protein